METIIGPVIGAFIGALVAGIGAAWIVGGSLGRLEAKIDQLGFKVEANGAAIARLEVKVDANTAAIAELRGQFAEHLRQHVAAVEP